METVTFLQENVQDYINNNFVAVKYNSRPNSEQSMRSDVRMTPSYIVLDAERNEIGRDIGHHAPNEINHQIN